LRVRAASLFVDDEPEVLIDGWKKEDFPGHTRNPYSLILTNTACGWRL
jgi:hypothetical protein